MTGPADIPATVAVLDTEKHGGGRRLADTVMGTGLTPLQYRNLEDFSEALEVRDALIGVVAFEALWPDPQKTLRALRDKAGGCRLIVIYSEGAPRWRLGQRLWSIGLFDYYTPRSTPPHEMRPILRQAWADALVAIGPADSAGSVDGTSDFHRRIRSLSTLGAAFAGQQAVEGLMRELQTRLPQLLDYNLLEVLVVGDDDTPRMFRSQTRPVDHEDIWALAQDVCAAVRPLVDFELSPETLAWEGDSPLRPVAQATSSASSKTVSLKTPMVIGGELVGCLGINLPHDPATIVETRTTLQIIASHLGTSLRSAAILEQAENQALTDELTGAFNRRYLNRILDAEWKRALRYDLEMSVALVDIDHFKQINDTYGHLAGDHVLINLVKLLTSELREIDHVVRYGGEEFLLLLPQTGPSSALMVLERLRRVASEAVLYDGPEGTIGVTISAGVAAFPTTAASTPEHLIEFADEALYSSKRAGRNQVTMSAGRSTKVGSRLASDGKPDDRRRHPRVEAEMRVRFVPLPGIDGQIVHLETIDVSAGGLSVRGPEKQLQINSLALLYAGEQDRPALCRVIWTQTDESGEHIAGLRYVGIRDIASDRARDRSGQRALILCDDPRVRAQVQRVLRAAQCETDVVVSDDSPLLSLDNMSLYSLFVVGESKLRGNIGANLKKLRRNPNVRIVVINEGKDRRQALGTIHTEQVEHMVPSPAAEESLFATLNKLLLGEYFGIKKYLLWGAVSNSWRLESSAEKQAVLDGIVDMAKEVKCHPRVIDLLVLAVDEMIVNALFRPASKDDRPRPVTVECGSDGRLLAVSVVDEHGALDSEDIFEGIGAALETEQEGIPEGATHAHLGFRIMLDALSQLSVNVDPGRCTEIIGIVDLRRSLREHRAAVPGLGLFRNRP